MEKTYEIPETIDEILSSFECERLMQVQVRGVPIIELRQAWMRQYERERRFWLAAICLVTGAGIALAGYLAALIFG